MTQRTCSIDRCSGRVIARGWCAKHYYRWQTHGNPTGGGAERPRLSAPELFWARVDRRGPDECWPWLGYCTRNGYGSIMIDGRVWVATRLALEVVGGQSVPDGLHVCHRCDNPPCVNPAHLFVGTATDNMRDAARKGRLVIPTGGETHHLAKLTADDVREIRRVQMVEGINDVQMAKRYGVASGTIRLIRTGATWKHVQ